MTVIRSATTALSVVLSAGMATAQTPETILIDFGGGTLQEAFDETGSRLPVLALETDGGLKDLQGSDGGEWWIIRAETFLGVELYIAGQATQGKTVVEEGFTQVSSTNELINSIDSSSPKINAGGQYALVADDFNDFLDPSRNGEFTFRRLDARVLTGTASFTGTDVPVDFFAAEGQDLSLFANLPGQFDPDVVIGRTELYNSGAINLIDNFILYGLTDTGSLVFGTGINGTGIVNSDGQINVSGTANDFAVFLDFGGINPSVLSQRGVTTFDNLQNGFVELYNSFAFGQVFSNADATRFAAEASVRVAPGITRSNQVVIDGKIVIGPGSDAMGNPLTLDGEPITDVDNVFMTPLGDWFAAVERTPQLTQYDEEGDPVFISDDSPNIRRLEDPRGGLLVMNGEIIAREKDPVVPGSNLLWDDVDQIEASDDPLDLFTNFDENGVFLGQFQRFTVDGDMPIYLIAANNRGDYILGGETDDQDPMTFGTYAVTLNGKRVIFTNGVQLDITGDGIPDNAWSGIEQAQGEGRAYRDGILGDDGFVHMMTYVLNTPTPNTVPGATMPFERLFDIDPATNLGTAFIRYRAFYPADIDRDNTGDFFDVAKFQNEAQAGNLPLGDYNLDGVIDQNDPTDFLAEFSVLPI